MIQTIRSRGFRFVADVVPGGMQAAHDADVPAAAREQVVRYCRTSDDVSIAYATSGSGRPLIKAANWLNHLEFDWASPVWRDMFTRLSARNTLVRYDARGSGLSDRDVADISFARFAADLEAVIEASGHRRFALLGISQGAAVAIRYAVAHPERVSHLILWGGFARGRRRRKAAPERAQADAFLALLREGWGRDHPVFRKLFATLYLPDATPEQLDWWIELQRVASSAEVAARTRVAIDGIDITGLLARVQAPTLILHSAHEAVAPLAEARLMAAGIKGSRVVPLESANHVILPQEPDWQRAMAEIDRFLEAS
jgi:pimeloyl-ACP methyl ester carboxylesterase